MNNSSQKLWGGRFQKGADAAMEDFHSSIQVDCRMAEVDILGSIAHARMLGRQGIVPEVEAARIIEGLNSILLDLHAGKLVFSKSAEDIHMNIELLLTERIGEAGKRLHTGRSRNDQVALDTRMYLKRGVDDTCNNLYALMRALLNTAGEHLETIMPGYTHLQKAQPITLAHHLMAYFEMFRRDAERLQASKERMDEMPLGAGALASSTYPLDREMVAEELGFACITRNSLDSVSDRDFCIEFVSCASILMMHLSRFCEELILWNTDEFRFVEMDDTYSTGSSIMPQKKNPDVAELIRGKTGRVYGDLMTLLSMMKGLPLAYNKDMQEDKEATFDALDTVNGCLTIFTRMFETLTFHTEHMRAGAGRGFTNATDAADYLVKKGVPFRTAHEIVGKLVFTCLERGIALHELPLLELQAVSPVFDADVYDAISLSVCVNERSLPGGPAPEAVKRHMEDGYMWLIMQEDAE
ncbi:argininosuccinate lyase [Christensenellaceae bacterium OttesenSCG-928-L17]|nr:argininosuccinate lyase [Christensenellaceae bacterium OttesenSCG-928-L17]